MTRRFRTVPALALALALELSLGAALAAEDPVVPHNQDRPPGPAAGPEEARQAFRLPDGFRLELVASEPDIVNPVKMRFGRDGRIWIVESVEYPRMSAGEGRDRIKILEDTDGDGRTDRVRVFAEGLNIPGGIAIGHGGVFVTNSPDVLFIEDTDGDDRADRRRKVLTGFGRHDTHEVPNTLTWGPDGWLYGLNGVFNPANIEHKGEEYRFTCALWRWHPVSEDFELFAEGTSNPWGLGFDREGAAFVEACVIDHLFHLAETGYYRRQGGRYPPFTWIIESIVEHHNYKAAYCGLEIYDAEAYPEAYRGRVYYGNIHGNCINADELERRGSTYFARPAPILLQTEDPWFMPVDIRLGPDGCLYVLDWYDRYHCYQDARRDPEGIDRRRGRLWRIVYGDERPEVPAFDLEEETPEELHERLRSPNRWWRDRARLLLAEDLGAETAAALRRDVLDRSLPQGVRMDSLWTLLGAEVPGRTPRHMTRDFHLEVLGLEDAGLRSWGVRAAGNIREVAPAVRDRVVELAADPSPDVRLRVAVASRKLLGEGALPVLLEVLVRSGGDVLLPKIVWENLEPLLEEQGPELVRWLEEGGMERLPPIDGLLGRVVERLLAREADDPDTLARLVGLLLRDPEAHGEAAAQCLEVLARSLVTGELEDTTRDRLRPALTESIEAIAARGPGHPLYLPAVTIAASWSEPRAIEACRRLARGAEDADVRAAALRALLIPRDPSVLEIARDVLAEPAGAPEGFVREVLGALGRLETPEVAGVVLEARPRLSPALRPQAIDLLAQRPVWAEALLDAVADGRVPSGSLNVTQVRRLLALRDEDVTRRVRETWGVVREGRDPEREEVIARMKEVLAAGEGDPWAGKAAFEKACAQCHVIFGEGQDVGPDITVNGRETLDVLLSNVLDPNLVIGKDYYAHDLLTRDGRALTGLLVEDSPQRVVLRVAGGEEEVVPRRDVLDLSEAEVSLMPEGIEETITEQEFRDLIAFLRFDAPPPPPVPTRTAGSTRSAEPAAIAVEQTYGRARVLARFPRAEEPVELFAYRHSHDARPYLHPLRAPRGGPALTGAGPADGSVRHGLHTGHPDAGGIDFLEGQGWVRSRGLRSVEVDPEAGTATLVSVAHWMSERRGGKRRLVEEERLVAHAPERPDRWTLDVTWRLTPDAELVLGRAERGGLALRLAEAAERRLRASRDGTRRPWLETTGRFGEEAGTSAGVAVFDHPRNPRFPAGWRDGGEGVLGPLATGLEDRRIPAGETLELRYRILVHDGSLEQKDIEAAFRRWAPGATARLEELERRGLRRLPRDWPEPVGGSGSARRLAGFSEDLELLTVGEQGVRVHPRWRGRPRVLQTHPWSRDVPAGFRWRVDVPPEKPRLALSVSHHPRGNWRLEIWAGDERLVDRVVGEASCGEDGWLDVDVDLGAWAGRRVDLRFLDRANDWSWEFGYWTRPRLTSGRPPGLSP